MTCEVCGGEPTRYAIVATEDEGEPPMETWLCEACINTFANTEGLTVQ